MRSTEQGQLMASVATTTKPAVTSFLLPQERRHLAELRSDTNARERSGYSQPQFQTFTAALSALEQSDEEKWSLVAQWAVFGIQRAAEVNAVTPYIFPAADGISRIVASVHRANLRAIHIRLGGIIPPRCERDAAILEIRRACVAATIAAEKGAIHIARENLGFILARLHASQDLAWQVIWSRSHLEALARTRGTRLRAP